MVGFPPRQLHQVNFADGSWYGWPQLRWSFNHIEELVPTKTGLRNANA
ncbi:MAG: hypothetical protein ACJAYE_001808 [Candidatus Azotimanducaceae bacterium]|jgi:hypothetical protein